MKIYSIEIETDVGRRVVKLAGPLDVTPTGDMPQQFRSLTELLWDVVRQGPALEAVAPKAEA